MDTDFSAARVEAFSDGVFAIAITLLILEIRIPEGTEDVGAALLHIWPSYLAYVTSFLTIGVIWLNHHLVFTLLSRVDRVLVAINTVMLMVVAFIPFPTRLVAEFLRKPQAEDDAALAYAVTFVVLALVFELWWRWITSGRRLVKAVQPGDLHLRDGRGGVVPQPADLGRDVPRARRLLRAAGNALLPRELTLRPKETCPHLLGLTQVLRLCDFLSTGAR